MCFTFSPSGGEGRDGGVKLHQYKTMMVIEGAHNTFFNAARQRAFCSGVPTEIRTHSGKS